MGLVGSQPASRPFGQWPARLDATLGRPVSRPCQILGWLLATGMFLGFFGLWYQGTPGDLAPTATTVAAIEQGFFSCAYPAASGSVIPPLYPALAAGVLWTTHLGRNELEPYTYSGRPCHHEETEQVGLKQVSPKYLVLVGLIAWPFLLGGFAAVMWASRRNRTGWELVGASVLAVTPAVQSCVASIFHPEDLIAIGLVLGAVAMAIRQRWLAAGLCIGLALSAKQFALLAAFPLLIVTPARDRWRYGAAMLGASGVVLVPSALLMGRGLFAAMAGGSTATPGRTHSTVVGLLAMSGVPLVMVSRILPILLAGALAFWAHRRVGARIYRPSSMLSLLATAMALRLVFEVNVFNYYLMATAATLLIADVASGRVRSLTIGWILLTSAFYPPLPDGLVPVEMKMQATIAILAALSGVAIAVTPLIRQCLASPLEPSFEPIELTVARSVLGRH
ncbi:MAG: hypothetical protein ACRDVW_06515 [Acidimicrobiales bacterium]